MNGLNRSALYRLLQGHSASFGPKFLTFLLISAGANALILATTNAAAENAAVHASNFRYLIVFMLLVAIFILAQRRILYTTAEEVEQMLGGIRDRISAGVARADLITIEQVGRSEIYASLHRETITISQASQMILLACQGGLMVCFSLFYLAHLSMAALVLTALMMTVASFTYFKRADEMNRSIREASVKEHQFFETLTHMLDGFKEVRLHGPRSEDLSARLRAISSELRNVKARAGRSSALQLIAGQLSVFLTLAGVVFILPLFTDSYTAVVLKAATGVLFIVGPISTILMTIPTYAMANIAAENIAALESALAKQAAAESDPKAPVDEIKQIRLRDVVFEYHERHSALPFKVGPIDLTIKGGETIFIVGGNGSGKSTLLKVIAGLYAPQAGTMSMNRTAVTPPTAAWYRSHFSAIFSDYHLFDRLYGMRTIPSEQVDLMLANVELSTKTQFVDGRFSTLDLSIGQRKRLALVVLMLENRPVLLFDEWAAEQDPPFRRHFYEEVLPKLKADGRTVIAVTHDDRYQHLADRVLRMEYGMLEEMTP